jgi:hypothetical protein
MNGYGLAAAIVQALASLGWPIAFVVAVWLFRERISALLPLLRLKHKDWEMSFRLDEAEKEAAALPDAPRSATPTPEEKSRFEKLAEISPRAAVLEIRVEIEDAVRSLAYRVDMPAEKMPIVIITRALRARGTIDAHLSGLIDDLTKIGNSAAHDADVEVSGRVAKRYRKLADLLLSQIAAIVHDLGHK